MCFKEVYFHKCRKSWENPQECGVRREKNVKEPSQFFKQTILTTGSAKPPAKEEWGLYNKATLS